MDTCGFPKDNYFYYKAWWGNEPVLHLFPHWNWPQSRQGQDVSVWCHTNLDSVELFLNGKSLGTQNVTRNKHVEWKVPFQPGTLEVRGTQSGKVILTDRRQTTGPASQIILRPDRTTLDADGADVSMVTVEVHDANGLLMPVADNDIHFELSGPGLLLGLGNGDPSSHESDKASHRKVFNGLAQAIVQSTSSPGDITLRATSPGLQTAVLTLTTRTATAQKTIL